MAEFSIETCPDYQLVKLPHKSVVSHDGEMLELGSVLYHRLSPATVARQYVVLSPYAVRIADHFEVMLIGPTGIPLGKDPADYVTNPDMWWEARMRKYGNPSKEKGRNHDGRSTRSR